MVSDIALVVKSLKGPGQFQCADRFGNRFCRLFISFALYFLPPFLFKKLQAILSNFSDPFLLSVDMMVRGPL